MKIKNLRKRRTAKQGYKTISILGEGNSEHFYFQGLKECEKEKLLDLKVSFKPEKPADKGRKCTDILKEAIELIDEYDTDYVFCVLDNDTIINCPANHDNYRKELNLLKKFCSSRKHTKVNVLEFPGNLTMQNIRNSTQAVIILKNMPCLEFWYLLHFEYRPREENKCGNIEKLIKAKHIRDYSKKQKWDKFKKIYFQLRDKLPEAANNARKINRLRLNNPDTLYSFSDLFYLIQFLNIL